MCDSKSTEAERALQSQFSFLAPLLLIALPVCVIAAAEYLLPALRAQPPPEMIEIAFDPVPVPRDVAAPLALAGAWQIDSEQRRLAGVSAIAVDGNGLVLLTDFGMVGRLPKPGGGKRAFVRPLPAGPGDPHYKKNRDSESLARDPAGRGWWVGFERRDQLWLYAPDFSQARRRLIIRDSGWGANSGLEGLIASGDALLLVPERGEALFRIAHGDIERLPVGGAHARLSDAAMLPDGRILAVERGFGWRGFSNALLMLERNGPGFRVVRRIPLGLSPLDNAEAIAVERLPGGGLRLWVATDDNGQRPLRTLLLAFDVPQNWLRG